MNDSQELNKENAANMSESEICSGEATETQNETEMQLTELQNKVSELQNELALARADFYNYRQRIEKERARMRASISEDRVLDFIPVLDNLDRALCVSPDSTASDVLKGVKMVQRQFLSVLQDIGVEAIAVNLSDGYTDFDPLLHDAVGADEVSDPNLDRRVVQELLRGYRAKERVLRPAQVRVGKYVPPEE
ncbi:MAG: nucleotide exchange factor GrpE [Synergistaceae bacterium]|nr:nucleotide exchange factor GrpE [Synergistaceae bacterium]